MNETRVDYLNGKLFPMILKFSIPAAISLLITAIYNIVDILLWCAAQGVLPFSVYSPVRTNRKKGFRSYGNRISICDLILSDCGFRMCFSRSIAVILQFCLCVGKTSFRNVRNGHRGSHKYYFGRCFHHCFWLGRDRICKCYCNRTDFLSSFRSVFRIWKSNTR